MEFVSESITPDEGTFDRRPMGRAEPGLPAGFIWRDKHFVIVDCLSRWKQSQAENHTRFGERYLRKHFYRVRTDTDEVMILYCQRHTKTGQNPKRRWWLYGIEA